MRLSNKRGFTQHHFHKSKRGGDLPSITFESKSGRGFTQHHFFSKSGAGFTLIEILLVVGIMAILFSVAAANFYSYSRKRELVNAANILFGYVSLAQQKAISAEEDLNWGVYLEYPAAAASSSFCSLFASSTYSAAVERERKILPSRVKFSDPASGQSKNFIFEKNSGKLTAGSATSTTLYLVSDPAETKSIFVSELGKIEVQ